MRLFTTIANRVIQWLDDRFEVTPLLEKNVTKKLVPNNLSWFGCMGGLAVVTFVLQVATGIFLMMYYIPSEKDAFFSVQKIRYEVPMGWLIQRVHAIGANVMILLVILHMTRVLYRRVYRHPRELHWVSGVLLFCLACFMGFSGYVLPNTELGFWASKIGTEIPAAVPVVGDQIVEFTRGGKHLGTVTLTRFYAIHTWLLPSAIGALMGLHFMVIRRTGIAGPL